MRFLTLFNDKSTDIVSAPFAVLPGQIVMLSAFGFAGKQQVADGNKPLDVQRAIVEKVVFAKGLFPDGVACSCGDLLIDVPYMYVEDVTQCGLWYLSACQNLVFLTVPGSYRLRLNDATALGTVHIELIKYDSMELTAYIPHDLYLGELSNG